MDPLSAVLAFTGLSASLIQIADVIFEASKKLYELQRKLKDAPKKIVQLHHDLLNLRALVIAVQARFAGNEITDYPAVLQSICESFTTRLEQDMRELEVIVNKSYEQLNTSHRKGFKAQVRHVLTESTTNEIHGRISTYIGYLNVVLTLTNQFVPSFQHCQQILTLLNVSHEISHLRQHTVKYADEARVFFKLMSSQMRSPQVLNSQHRMLLASDSEDYNHSRSEEGPVSSLELSEQGGVFEFGLGLLSVKVFRIRFLNQSSRVHGGDNLRLKVSFLPPSWMSRTGLCATIDVPGQSFLSSSWPSMVLQPVTVNQNPDLLDAFHYFDLKKLRHLFATKQVRPTDMIMDLDLNEPVPLGEALLRVFIRITPCSNRLCKHQGLVAFLVSQGISPSAEAITAFFLGMKFNWAYDRPQQLTQSKNCYLRALLDCQAISLDAISIPNSLLVSPGFYSFRYGDSAGRTNESILPTLVESPLGFEGLKYCLFHHSQSWTLEDLSGRGLWYVATLAHADETFRRALRSRVFSFRSNMNADEEGSLDHLIESVCGIKDIVSEVESAILKERSLFLSTLSSKGTPAMVRPFLESTIDLDEGQISDDYLGCAAVNENIEVFKMLLAAGASTARAIQQLCENDHRDFEAFNQLFDELLENLNSAKNQVRKSDYPDTLTAIIKSDRAVTARPDAPRLLLRSNVFVTSKLHGADHMYPCHSYVLGALAYNRVDLLEGLLEYGPPLDRTMSDMFKPNREHFQTINDYNWLILAVELGRSDCVRLILARSSHQEHAIYYPDGAGRTPLQIAQSFVATSHPRKSVLNGLHWIENQEGTLVSAEEDEATLQIIQVGLGGADVSVSALSENMNTATAHLLLVQSYSSTLLRKVNTLGTSTIDLISEVLSFSPKGLSCSEVVMNCTTSRCATCTKRRRQDMRRSQWARFTKLNFLEACLVRMSYCLAIGIILICDFTALCVSIKGLTRLRWPPSWIVTSSVLLLVVWISMK